MYVYGKEEYITGLNDGNVFAFIINDIGSQELITPPADGLIVPGITRRTVLEMARHWVSWMKGLTKQSFLPLITLINNTLSLLEIILYIREACKHYSILLEVLYLAN